MKGVSRANATSKMELFVILVSNFQLLNYATKTFILRVSRVLDQILKHYNML